jgi:fluoroacetyl-CoA thioesterase
MREPLKVGLAGELRFIVAEEMSAPHLPRKVLATPAMISLIESTCLRTVAPHLDEGETTVGTHVCVSHDDRAEVGSEVTVSCRLAKIERRRLTFDVTVAAGSRRLSEGTHQRAVVSLARMAG